VTKQLTDQGRERKQQLLDRAAELFSDRGYANTRIIDICDAAGVAKGFFYLYFENKDSLFVELVASMRQRLRVAQGQAMRAVDSPLDRLVAGTEASLRFMAEHGSWFRFIDTELADRHTSSMLRAANGVYVDDVLRLLEAGITDGSIVAEPARAMAVMVVATVNQFSQSSRNGHLGLDLEETIAMARAWLRRALAAPQPGALAVTTQVAAGITNTSPRQ
jgi:AcrR family transcriptional regulator